MDRPRTPTPAPLRPHPHSINVRTEILIGYKWIKNIFPLIFPNDFHPSTY